VGDELLRPSVIYSPAVRALLGEGDVDVRAVAHVTGGGLVGNLPRVLPDGLDAEVDRSTWEVPRVFTEIQRHGRIDDGEMARVFNLGIGMVVAVPPDYDIEVWRRQAQTTPQADLLYFIGLKHVALIGTLTSFRDGCGVGVDRAAFTFTLVDSTLHRVPAAPLPQRRPGCGDPRPFGVELWVAGSGTAWPTGTDYLARRLNLPDALSEISGSGGFVGGVLTRTVPFEACEIVAIGPVRDHCKLRYDGSTATLSGTLRDATCGGPVVGAVVQLREIDPGLPTPYRIRPTGSGAAGEYRIGALQTGLRHVLTVRQTVAGVDLFTEFADTLRSMFDPQPPRA
jgi:hypothetical protein